MQEQSRPSRPALVPWIGLVAGPLLAALALATLPEPRAGGELSEAGRATAAVVIWMACWWLTEAVPLAATALLPLAVFPLLGIATIQQTAAPYASHLVFLFLGGFILGLGLQRFGLHRRLALSILLAVGTGPRRLVGGFMLSTAALSMWISNTATVIMMLPIGLSVLELLREQGEAENLGPALMLGVAYAASIGGVGTLIGTPPNLVLASYLAERHGLDIGMLEWMSIGGPLVLVLLPITWLYLTRIAYPLQSAPGHAARSLVAETLSGLGPPSRGEWVAGTVFALTALGWILRPWLARWTGLDGLSDAGIAMLGALVLFVVPVDPGTRTFAMDWDTARRLPWDVLILFGGGLCLADAVARHGLDAWIGSAASGLVGAPVLVLLLVVCTTVVFLTEVTSNTAVTATLLPVAAAAALALGVPVALLLTTVALSASCAFMLPVATPPNAIVFASRRVTVGQMARTGFALNLVAIALISSWMYLGGSPLEVPRP